MTDRFDWLELEAAAVSQAPRPVESYDPRAYLQQADLDFRRGAREGALRLYAKTLGEDASRWEAWLGQVLCLIELGEAEEARTWSSKALDRFPQCPELLAAKGLVLAALGEPAEAMELADAAMDKRSPSGWVWLLRGMILLRIEPERRGEARCFEKALEHGDGGGGLSLRAGLAYLGASEHGKARPLLERAIERDPENPLAWHSLGRAFQGLYVLGRAASCYERALQLKPEFKDEVVEALHRLHGRPLWLRAWARFRVWCAGV